MQKIATDPHSHLEVLMDRRLSHHSWALLLAVTFPLGALAQPVSQQASRTTGQKIADALSAAPASVSRNATVMDWPMTTGGPMQQLRVGSNGWVCYPTTPIVYENGARRDAMCLDSEFQGWANAWMGQTAPAPKRAAVAYMLQGDAGASNTDPYAKAPTSSNDWVMSGPHVMVIVPDPSSLDGMPTDAKNGGPWVMWKGTPYAHIMVPLPQQGTMRRDR
jgi:hypothetical protein